ncbi:3-oxoacyl-ACP synthase III family protein [Actinocrispum wychmicini]|uniref:3-oxoacyl-[acyl-carrier-protein] synthase-3 n=1 Tax=Actinocrispum wychmicini TaxID=1213861 RepID=A0A4R2K7J4_9PSEU|nr:3-oxoacyl-ACP synthase III family protein [Actinocrispum wychmicini]TCO62325.1 3-oxoacyl-[acyl-carrier-protein] synthase-3 [Actinocrispum wychmicini]
MDIRISSAGSALPGPSVDNPTLARRFGMEPLWEQWIDVFIGTATRHLAVDLATGEIRSSLAELGETAARRALTAAGLTPGDVDVVVLGTATPDKLMPATVNVIADRLGIDGVPTYQLQSGCCGAVQALDVARHMLMGGQCRTALVIGGDVCAKFFDLGVDLRKLPPSQLVNVVLFGDGAGAAVLSADPASPGPVLRCVINRLVGLNRPPGQVLDWFGPVDRNAERPAVSEDYKAIEESVPLMAAEILKELLDAVGWAKADLDFLLPPQLSGRMTERITRELAVDAVPVNCVEQTGNTGNALPFLQLERLLGRMTAGQRAVCVAIESSKWIKAGFAVEKA